MRVFASKRLKCGMPIFSLAIAIAMACNTPPSYATESDCESRIKTFLVALSALSSNPPDNLFSQINGLPNVHFRPSHDVICTLEELSRIKMDEFKIEVKKTGFVKDSALFTAYHRTGCGAHLSLSKIPRGVIDSAGIICPRLRRP